MSKCKECGQHSIINEKCVNSYCAKGSVDRHEEAIAQDRADKFYMARLVAEIESLKAENEKLKRHLEIAVKALERQRHPHIEEFCKERAYNALAQIEKERGE